MTRLYEVALAVLLQLVRLCSATDILDASRDSRIKHQTDNEALPSSKKTLTDTSKFFGPSNKRHDKKHQTVLMKKIGLEIPESTRKDMDEPSATRATSLSKLKSASIKRLLIDTTGTTTCPDYMIIDSNGVNKVCTTTTTGSCRTRYNHCVTCTTSRCTSCDSGYQPVLGQCTCSSPDMFDNGVSCQMCISPCTTCNSATYCTGCVTGYSLQGSSCVPSNVPNCVTHASAGVCSTCISNYEPASEGTTCSACSYGYASDGGACLPCNAMCANCHISSTNCLNCASSAPLKLSDNTCVASCGSGKYYASQACNPCHASCVDCIGGGPNQCTSCMGANNYIQIDSRVCGQGCPVGQFPSGVECLNCVTGCAQCSNGGVTSCSACQGDYFLRSDSSCQTSCTPGTYPNSGTRKCEPCDTSCAACSGALSNQCTQCPAGKYLTIAKLCKDACESNEWADSNKICSACDSSCKTCTNSGAMSCQSCDSPRFLSNWACVANCPEGEIQNVPDRTCYPCHASCLTCSAASDPNACLTCPTGRVLSGTYCNKTCLANQYYTQTGDACNVCDSVCSSCTGPGSLAVVCTCSSSYFKMPDTNCVVQCPAGYFADSSKNCKPCHGECQTCYGPDNNNCETCVTGKFRTVAKFCKTSCESNEFFVNNTNLCQSCNPTFCMACSYDNTNCTECSTGKFLFLFGGRGSCVSQCPTGYLENATIKKCQACATQCATCNTGENPFNCITCAGNRTLRADKYCTRNCPSTQYFTDTNDTCNDCHALCATCTGPGYFECPTCASSAFRLLSGDCVGICPEGTYADASRTCQNCHSSCKSCSGPNATNCLSCNSTLFRTTTLECKSSCADHQWFNATNYCFACHSSCNTCGNSSSNNDCLSCYDDNWLNKLTKTCVTSCPDYYMPVNATWTCEPCATTCKTCSAVQNPLACTSCDTTARFLRTDGYCQKNCSTTIPQYFVDANDSCVNCHSLCKSCTNGSTATNCTECRDNAFRHYLGDCVSTCPSDTYAAANRTCQPCDTTCLTCSGPLSTNCLICPANQYRTASKACKTSCDPHEWYDSSRFCTACDATCDTCSGSLSTECLTCNSTAYKFTTNSSCQTPCPNGFMDNNITRICGVCHANCKKCSEERNAYKCMSCFSDRKLRTDGYCVIPCRDGQYFDDNSDSCQPCHPYCATCGGGGLSDCINCAQGLFLSYTSLCVKACPSDSFLNGTTCVKCHRSCSTCSGPTAMNCLTCPGTQVLTVAKACSDMCDPAEVANSQQVCEKCHPTCSSCKSPSIDGCLACQNPDVTTLSAAGNCLNCLINPEVDPETCWYSVPLSLSKASTRGLSLQASTTIRLSFRNESLFQSRIDGELLKQVLVFDVPGLSATEWVWLFRQTGGEMLIDLYFMESKAGDFKLVARPKEQIILKNSAGIAELIFWNKSAEYAIDVRKAPDAGVVEALTLASSRANSAGAVVGTVSSIMSVVAIASASGLGAPLLKILRIFKLLSRLRLINVFFGSYLEVFLQAVGRLYALGGDDITLQVAKLTPKSRGKLDMYKVSVLSADVMALKYAVYFLSLAVRIYRAKIRGYALQRDSLSLVDAILDSIGERCKTMLLVMVGIDIVFYSLRCVSHMDVMGQLDFIASCSFLLSMITIVVFVLEFYMLIEFNMNTAFTALRRKARMARVIFKRAAAIKSESKDSTSKATKSIDRSTVDESTDGTVILINSGPSSAMAVPKLKKVLKSRYNASTKKRGAIGRKPTAQKEGQDSSVHDTTVDPNKDLEQSTLGSWKAAGPKNVNANQLLANTQKEAKGDSKEVENLKEETNNDKLSEYLYGYRQQKRVIDNPSAEQFFGNGIKLHKLRTPEGRYYNTVALVKMFALEPLFINLQMFSTTQIVAIYLVQLAFVVWTVRAGVFKRVFTSVVAFIALVVNEVAVLVFLTVGVFFQLAGGERAVSSSTSSMVQFVAIGAIALACVVGLLEFFVSIILAVIKGIQDRKLAMAQKAVNNHRDEMKSVRHRVIGRDLPGAEPPVPPVDADMSSSVADIKANQVGQSAKPVLGKTRLAPGKRLSRPPLQPLARK